MRSLLNLKQLVRRLARADGAEIAEAALVLPLVFMLLLGIVWFGRAFNIYSTIQQAAQQGAIVAARSSCATCGDQLVPVPIIVSNTVDAVMQASSIDPAQIPVNSNAPTPFSCVPPIVTLTCPVSGHISVCRKVLLNSPLQPNQTPQCGTIVSFQYPFQFYLPFTSLNLQKITLSAQAQSRMEN
jgi:TadE-like protein